MKTGSVPHAPDGPGSENASRVLPQSLVRVSYQSVQNLRVEGGKRVLGSLDGCGSAFVGGIAERHEARMILSQPAPHAAAAWNVRNLL
jgi:hypothetical protein